MFYNNLFYLVSISFNNIGAFKFWHLNFFKFYFYDVTVTIYEK